MRRRDKGHRHGRDTTVARFTLARANEEMVLADSSLKGERRVAVIRLAVLVLLALSQFLVSRWGTEPYAPVLDGARKVAIAAYALFACAALLVLHYQTPHPQRARWFPLPTALADTSFFSYMAWHTWQRTGQFDGGMLAGSLGMVLAFSVARYSWLHVLLSTVLSSAGYALLAVVTGHGSPARICFVVSCYVALGVLIALTNADVGGMFLNLRRRDGLSRFLPKQLVERMMQLGDEPLQPVQREVTILFSDIRDFTALSESLQPREVLELLDDYFAHMTHIVMARDGIVNKFLGDGMLACWGVPDHREDHAELAMRAALDMRAKLEELNAHREQKGQPRLRIGIGLHTGVVAAGMLGGAEQHEYTVIGDAVNLASRVEGLTKTLGVDILVSESTWLKGGERFAGERLGEAHVRGRRGAVVVYTLERRLATGERPAVRAATGT
ncbi:adenylate/guanylate cyclase domain-containing protein [Pyxidicoccus fallax]|uniref:Adenylate/guanylate cyclase domain-containing protein n=1 Tax=Pyxidicoccus fallax TaxID=394095 RepID=A0A848LZK6_9BACT|nr:adenylate/guanylate cyclase domain-containing protein [Pyxidicoccus fallax]NMO23069.1 adenylate/guanylate cyclase domain-containing protein [Pyxidicoccus fallax]NPC85676.1 adenylate/guanylate cyclase domain-containing protein [Pyxidicoccus fallax]